MKGRISIYTVDLQLNPPDGVVEPAVMLESEEDGYLFITRGLYSISFENSKELEQVRVSNKEFIVNITI